MVVVYVGLCSSRVDKNLTIIAVIEIHNSNVVELLIFEILTPNFVYAADEIFSEKMDCLLQMFLKQVAMILDQRQV